MKGAVDCICMYNGFYENDNSPCHLNKKKYIKSIYILQSFKEFELMMLIKQCSNSILINVCKNLKYLEEIHLFQTMY